MKLILVVVFGVCLSSCKNSIPHSFQLVNPADFDRTDVITVPLSEFELSDFENVGLFIEGEQLDADWIDSDGDKMNDLLRFQDLFLANSTKSYELKKVGKSTIPVKLTQAEISVKQGGTWDGQKYIGGEFQNVTKLNVPAEHTDHSYFIRYEGPGWESDWAAYRFYLDWRNGVDYFGKLTEDLVLQGVGLDGFDSYHDYSSWGMDLLKVGKTLGLGSIGRFQNDTLYRFHQVSALTCEIIENGIFYSQINTNYENWKTESDVVSLESIISISAGSAFTHHEVVFSQPMSGFCTGLVISKNETYISESKSGYRYLVSYGPYSLNKDQIGLALIVPESQIEILTEGSGSHVVIFKPAEKVDYYFAAVWEKGPKAIKNVKEFDDLVMVEIDKLANPVILK